MTGAELAGRMGWTPQSFYNMLFRQRGGLGVAPRTLTRLALALHIPEAELVEQEPVLNETVGGVDPRPKVGFPVGRWSAGKQFAGMVDGNVADIQLSIGGVGDDAAAPLAAEIVDLNPELSPIDIRQTIDEEEFS